MKKSFLADVFLEILGLNYSDLEREIPAEDCTDWRERYSEMFPELFADCNVVRGEALPVRVPVGYGCCAGKAVGK